MSPHPTKKHRFSIFTIFFTFFIDNLGATIIFPLFAPLFLSEHHTLLSSALSYSSKAALLGLFLAAYPFSQLFFSPILGSFADKHGRKWAFIMTMFFTFLGYSLCAFSIDHKIIGLLFFSRLLMGAAGGSVSLCLSSLSDLSQSKAQKVKHFGFGSIIAGSTFVLGPFIGGKLSDSTLHHFFNLAFPLWVGAGLALINLVFLIFAFIETLDKKREIPEQKGSAVVQGARELKYVFKVSSIKHLYILYFFYLLSWNMLFQFIPAFLVTNFSESSPQIGDVCALLGLCWVVGSLILYKGLLPFFKNKTLLFFGGLFFAVFVFLCSFFQHVSTFTLVLGVSVVFASFGWPLCTGAISNAADDKMQGKILGFSQSVQSFAMLLAPIIVSPFLSKDSGVPFFIAASVGLLFSFLTLVVKIPEN